MVDAFIYDAVHTPRDCPQPGGYLHLLAPPDLATPTAVIAVIAVWQGRRR